MANYPAAIAALTRVGNALVNPPDVPAANGSATDAVVVVTAIQAEVEAIETELGVDPSGAAATVAARLAALDTTVAGKENAGVGIPASLVDAKGDLLTATADNTPARLAVGAEGDVLTVRGSVASGLAWAQPQPRNLLTVNQSSVETDTTGLAATTNCTIARTTSAGTFDDGTAALAVTSSAAGSVVAGTLTGTSGVPVVAGRLYSAMLTAKSAAITSNASARIRWWTSGGAAVSTTTGTASALSTSAFGLRFVAGLAPATAAHATVEVTWTAAAAGEIVYVDKFGLWEGYGGTWSLGGQSVQGIGERWDESVGRRCFRWDWNNSREQMVYGDTGWRLCGEWDAAGNFTAGLQVSAFSAPWASGTAGKWYMRRIGYTVEHRIWGVQASGLTSASAIFGTGTSIPTGFQAGEYEQIPVATSVGSSFASIGCAAARNYLCGYASAALTISRSRVSYITDQVWPTTLPGTSAILPPSA